MSNSKNIKDLKQWSCNERGKQIYKLGDNDLRRWYQRDIDQIIHSTAFRKLQRKTQLLSENDPRVRSRLIHTLEVSRIAEEISEKLGLNKELTEAICMGHDLGTSPYGCVGNSFLSDKVPEHNFSHELAGMHMLETLASKELNDQDQLAKQAERFFNKNPKLNVAPIKIKSFPKLLKISRTVNEKGDCKYYVYHMSEEILDGVLCHGNPVLDAKTLEAQVVRYSDNIAYLSQDIDDLVFSKIVPTCIKYTQCGAGKNLDYINPKTNENISMSWKDIDAFCSDTKRQSLKKVFSESRGLRIAALIDRFINYNITELNKGNLEFYYSEILMKQIPRLRCDPGLQHVINFVWNFIESKYNNILIRTSNEIQRSKIMQLWDILGSQELMNNNDFYKKFLQTLNNSRFGVYSNDWKKAYFISHLAWDEVDLIINSFHQRDYTFEIDIKEGNYANS